MPDAKIDSIPEAPSAPVDAADVKARHIQTLSEMSVDQRLVIARELLAESIRSKAQRHNVFVTREEALQAVFSAEASATNSGAHAQVDFFLPLTNNLPMTIDRD